VTQRPQGTNGGRGRRHLCPCGSGTKNARCRGRRSGQAASKPAPTSELFARALAHHQNGLLGEAEAIYAQVLRLEPENADALHFSGLIAHQQGRSEVAVDLMLRAIEREPGRATFFVNLGQVFEAMREVDKAVSSYRAAASLDPASEPAHHRLGDLLLKQGILNEAAASYSRALSLMPDSPETINSMGSLLQKVGKLEQAFVCYQRAISLRVNYAEAHNNLGQAHKLLGRLAEGIASCEQAVLLKPDLAGAHSNLGEMLANRGDFKEAVKALYRAIELEPEFYDAHLNLGNAYRGQGLLMEAVGSYLDAISMAQDPAGAYNNLAETYKDQDELDKAVAAFRKALTARPVLGAAYSNLLYLYAFTRHISPEAERAAAEGWERSMLTDAERTAARARAAGSSGAFSGHSRVGRRLRVGIVSADLGTHAVAEFLQPFLDQLDRSRFHLTLFPTHRRFCSRSLHLQSLADSFIPLTELSDSGAADRIRAENIDVLIDATGHTFGGRLAICAHRAAPVQCTYIGYWSTTGLSEMDWIIVDPFFLPSMEAHFTEGIWRLPRVAASYRGDPSLPESSWIPDCDGTIWLGSFNKYGKIRRDALCLWAKVLCALPEAKLLLEDRAPSEDETHRRILATLLEQGVSAERVTFVPPISDHRRHMALYNRLDIALDTIPFNSGTTAFDALWMGVPIVALEGNWSGGRLVSAALKAFDHRDWIAQSEQEYVSIVCSLARDPDGRTRLRKAQRARMAASPLCDANDIARSLEDALEAMYDARVAGVSRRPSPITGQEVSAQS
jgi:protein O-GlcNAc transferase